MLSFLAFLAYADTITLDTGAVVEGDLNRYEHGGDCEVTVTGGDLEGVVLIAPCFRVQSFVRTAPAPVPVARFEPPPASSPLPPVNQSGEGVAVADAAPPPPPSLPMEDPAPQAVLPPVAATYAPPPILQEEVALPPPPPAVPTYSMFGPAPDSAAMPQLEMPMAEPLPPPPVQELPVQEGSAIPQESRPLSF